MKTALSFRTSNLFNSKGKTPTLNLGEGDLSNHSLVNFTRASSKWYFDKDGLLKEASANTLPSSYDPATGERLGWYIEQSRTNEILDSRDLTTGNWVRSANITVTRDQTGVDGNANTACKLVSSGSDFDFAAQQFAIPDDSNTHTISGFIRKESFSGDLNFRTELINGTTEVNAPFRINLNTGEIITTGDGTNATVEDYGDWWKISISVTNNSTGNNTIKITIYPDGDADEIEEVTVDNIQLELNANFPSSPIVTGGSAVTRDGDVALITDLSWYNSTEGTFIVEGKTFDPDATYASGNRPVMFEIYEDDNNTMNFSLETGTNEVRLRGVIDVGGSVVGTGGLVIGNESADTNIKGALAYDATGYAGGVNGGAVATDTDDLTAYNLTSVGIGYGIFTDAHQVEGYIKSLTYYDEKFTNAEIQKYTQ